MSKERQQPEQTTIEHIVHVAREAALAHGGYIPTIFVKGSQQSIVLQVPELEDTHDARRLQMQMMGWLLGRGGQFGTLKQVFLVTEAWMSSGDEDDPPVFPPSQDPHRVEVLTIFGYQLETDTGEMRLLEMMRDSNGDLTDLQPFAMPDKVAGHSVQSPLMEAFVEGFRSGKTPKQDTN